MIRFDACFLNGKKTLSFSKCLTDRRLTNYLVWNLERGFERGQTLFYVLGTCVIQ